MSRGRCSPTSNRSCRSWQVAAVALALALAPPRSRRAGTFTPTWTGPALTAAARVHATSSTPTPMMSRGRCTPRSDRSCGSRQTAALALEPTPPRSRRADTFTPTWTGPAPTAAARVHATSRQQSSSTQPGGCGGLGEVGGRVRRRVPGARGGGRDGSAVPSAIRIRTRVRIRTGSGSGSRFGFAVRGLGLGLG
jgi:hypothetical protein